MKLKRQKKTKRQQFAQLIVDATPFLSEETKTQIQEYCEENSSISDSEFHKGFQSTFPWLDYHISLMTAHRLQNMSVKMHDTKRFTESTRNHLAFYTVLIALGIIISLFSLPFRM